MKTFELVMALAIVPFLALYFVIPESPRWLISKHRIDEAKAVLEKALKVNKMPLSLLHQQRGKIREECFRDRLVAFSRNSAQLNLHGSVLVLHCHGQLRTHLQHAVVRLERLHHVRHARLLLIPCTHCATVH